ERDRETWKLLRQTACSPAQDSWRGKTTERILIFRATQKLRPWRTAYQCVQNRFSLLSQLCLVQFQDSASQSSNLRTELWASSRPHTIHLPARTHPELRIFSLALCKLRQYCQYL